MIGPYAVFEIFNKVEAFIWFGAAFVLPFLFKAGSRKQRRALIGASFGFFLFGITDLLEAPTHGQVPVWLWGLKVASAAFLLTCRFTYIGWRNFRITDRWFVFAVICLGVSFAIFYLR
jgi:hypothetical protein|tara:strand:- start:25782 stop:26135 length:354 start_codon:yes stop_codon:yes gene_type:complete